MIFLFSLLWLICGVVSASFVIGNMTKQFPWLSVPWGLVAISVVAGPCGLFANLITTFVSKEDSFENCSFKYNNREKRFELFKQEFQILVDIGVADIDNFDNSKVVTKKFEEKYKA